MIQQLLRKIDEAKGIESLIQYWKNRVEDEEHPWEAMYQWAKANPDKIEDDPKAWAAWMHKKIFGMTPMERKAKMKEESLQESGKEVADTILQQLGGGRFLAMTGAKNMVFFSSPHPGLRFKISSRNKAKVNLVKITLMPSDTYEVEFGTAKGLDYKVVKTVDNVYADNLRSVFTDVTGLYTSL